MGTARRRRTGFGHAEMLDLAGRDQFLYRTRDILDRHVRIDATLIEEIDLLDAQALERRIGDFLDMLGTAVRPRHLAVDNVETEFGGNHHLVAHRTQGFSDHLLIGEGTIDLGRVEEGHTQIDCLADQRNAFILRQPMAVAEVEAHAAEAEGGNLKAAASKSAFLHQSFLVRKQFGNIRRCSGSCRQRGHIDHEAIADVGFFHPFKGMVDLIHADHLDIGQHILARAEIEHLLRLADAADW